MQQKVKGIEIRKRDKRNPAEFLSSIKTKLSAPNFSINCQYNDKHASYEKQETGHGREKCLTKLTRSTNLAYKKSVQVSKKNVC